MCKLDSAAVAVIFVVFVVVVVVVDGVVATCGGVENVAIDLPKLPCMH